MPKSKSLWTVAVMGLVILAPAACAYDKKPALGTSGNPVPSASSSSSSEASASAGGPVKFEVTAVEAAPGSFVFDTAGAERLPAGPVEFTFTNSGTQRHEARLIRI